MSDSAFVYVDPEEHALPPLSGDAVRDVAAHVAHQEQWRRDSGRRRDAAYGDLVQRQRLQALERVRAVELRRRRPVFRDALLALGAERFATEWPDAAEWHRLEILCVKTGLLSKTEAFGTGWGRNLVSVSGHWLTPSKWSGSVSMHGITAEPSPVRWQRFAPGATDWSGQAVDAIVTHAL